MITFPTGYEASCFEEFLRTFSRFKKERFESIPRGQRISVELMINEQDLEPNDFARLLAVVGEKFGLSQFGNHFGFGRFRVELIKRERVEAKLDFGVLQI